MSQSALESAASSKGPESEEVISIRRVHNARTLHLSSYWVCHLSSPHTNLSSLPGLWFNTVRGFRAHVTQCSPPLVRLCALLLLCLPFRSSFGTMASVELRPTCNSMGGSTTIAKLPTISTSGVVERLNYQDTSLQPEDLISVNASYISFIVE